MKKIVIVGLSVLLSTALMSCGSSTVQTAKKSTVEILSTKVQKGAVKLLGCETGEPVYTDVKGKLESLFKVQSEKSVQSASGVTSAKAFGLPTSLCSTAISVVMPYLVNLGEDKIMPESWSADGCNLTNIGDDIGNLVLGLCGESSN